MAATGRPLRGVGNAPLAVPLVQLVPPRYLPLGAPLTSPSYHPIRYLPLGRTVDDIVMVGGATHMVRESS